MANHKSAIKRIRSNEKKHQRNKVWRSKTRTQIKKAEALIETGNVEEARQAVKLATSILDKAAQKGVYHANNAARRVGRLNRQLAELETQK